MESVDTSERKMKELVVENRELRRMSDQDAAYIVKLRAENERLRRQIEEIYGKR